MGRLRRRRSVAAVAMSWVRLWAIPAMVTSVGIFVVNFALASTAPTPSQIEIFLQDSQLIPHSETVEGYQQIYYTFDDKKVFVTSDNSNHFNPKSSGRYIVWLGSINDLPSQVFLYDVMTNTTLQLSGYSTNTNPDLDANHVVWQQWVNNGWQVMYYDGLQVSQISEGSTSFRPRIYGTKVAYVTYDTNDSSTPWHIIEYDTQSRESTVVLATANSIQAWPHFTQSGELTNDYDLRYLSK